MADAQEQSQKGTVVDQTGKTHGSKHDIVTELRDWAAITDEVQGKATLVMLSGQVFADAADEIERLRAEINSMASAQAGWGRVARLNAENDALRAAGDALDEAIFHVSCAGSSEVMDRLMNAHDAWLEARRG